MAEYVWLAGTVKYEDWAIDGVYANLEAAVEGSKAKTSSLWVEWKVEPSDIHPDEHWTLSGQLLHPDGYGGFHRERMSEYDIQRWEVLGG